MKLIDVAEVIRSKNSGPYELTFDIIFKEYSVYKKVCENKLIDKKLISRLYNIDESKIITIVYFEPAKAVKATIVRPFPSGAIGETDVYGAQQHAPLFDIDLPI